jgi:deazaflavin-dependent oxidoreductase (nitroreductase family)
MTDPSVRDSPVGWVNRHIKAYVESGGEKGHEWRPGVPALIYGRAGADYVVVASTGGRPRNPAWYLNLSADPRVDVQVGAEKFPAVARTTDGAERDRLWAAMNEIWPSYEHYQEKTDREIPVVVLSRSAPADPLGSRDGEDRASGPADDG